MKIRSPDRFSSFYEAFSDLIFGTMAIFLLLMIVFLALIKQESQKSEAQFKEKLEQSQQMLEDAKSQAEQSRKQVEDLLKSNKELAEAIKFHPLQMVIAVDISGSMARPLITLRDTVKTLSVVLSKMTPDFQLAVVGFRQAQPNENSIHEFSLQQVLAEDVDGGRSQTQVDGFMQSLEASSGVATTSEALGRAIQILSQAPGENTVQVLMLLGDRGPYEYWQNTQIAARLGSEASRYDAEAVSNVKAWADLSKRRRIVTVFSGVAPELDPSIPKDNATGKPDQIYVDLYNMSKSFFSSLPAEAGQPQSFTDNEGKMLALLIDAILQGK